jgi:hypothetical protein
MSAFKIKLILTIPMFALSGMIFNEVVNNNFNIEYKIIYTILGLFFIYEPIRILKIKKTK